MTFQSRRVADITKIFMLNGQLLIELQLCFTLNNVQLTFKQNFPCIRLFVVRNVKYSLFLLRLSLSGNISTDKRDAMVNKF